MSVDIDLKNEINGENIRLENVCVMCQDTLTYSEGGSVCETCITKYECAICFESFEKSKTTFFETCDHHSCSDCFKRRDLKVQKGKIFDDTQFKCHICRTFIKSICESNMRVNIFLKEHREGISEKYGARSCERCETIFMERISCSGDPNSISNYCDKCLIKKISAKECPGCGLKIIKSKGCDHMTCTQCDTSWCWGCRYVFNTDGPDDNELSDIYDRLRENGWECTGNCSNSIVYDAFYDDDYS